MHWFIIAKFAVWFGLNGFPSAGGFVDNLRPRRIISETSHAALSAATAGTKPRKHLTLLFFVEPVLCKIFCNFTGHLSDRLFFCKVGIETKFGFSLLQHLISVPKP